MSYAFFGFIPQSFSEFYLISYHLDNQSWEFLGIPKRCAKHRFSGSSFTPRNFLKKNRNDIDTRTGAQPSQREHAATANCKTRNAYYE